MLNNKLKLKSVNKSNYSAIFSNTINNSYFEPYYNDENNNNSVMKSYKSKNKIEQKRKQN